MVKGLYTGAMGMSCAAAQHEAIANNLANITTTGFKRDEVLLKSFPKVMYHQVTGAQEPDPRRLLRERSYIAPYMRERPAIGPINAGVMVDGVATIFDEGPLQHTTNPFDLAIQGDGFFVIQTKEGEFYTRNGSFTLNAERELVTKEGAIVMGEGGPIRITGYEFVVRPDGTVLENVSPDPVGWEAPQEVGRLRIVDFENKGGLKKRGSTLFEATPLSGPPREALGFVVHQGYLEGSNVNPITELVRMIEVQRLYELNQKMIISHDDLLRRAINDVGAPR